MPLSRRPFRGRPVAKKIQHTSWELSNGNFTAQAAGTTARAFSSVGTAPTTLMRIRGEVMGFIDGVLGAGKLVMCSYGIILVPEGTGTTVLYDPFTDGNAPWLLYGQASLGYEELVTDVVDVPGITSFRHVIDNKAMRIIRPDVEMQFVMTNTSTVSAQAVHVAYGLRWLQGF